MMRDADARSARWWHRRTSLAALLILGLFLTAGGANGAEPGQRRPRQRQQMQQRGQMRPGQVPGRGQMPGRPAAPGRRTEADTSRGQAEPPPRLPAAVMAVSTGPVMQVAPLDRGRRDAVREAAEAIDRLLAAHWEAHHVAPSTPLDDGRFVRRAYLELGGRIPTFDETVAFLDAKDRDKREALVETLLESPDHVSHVYNFWADILRLTERPQNDLFFEPYLDWVKRSIAANRPYDAWVREMLTADGRLLENPAVGFQLRDRGMPLPYVDNTVRVFLGTQIGCAQCHDHPFDDWTQRQFYELAAFTAGTRMRQRGAFDRDAVPVDDAATLRRLRDLQGEIRDNVRAGKVDNGLRLFVGANLAGVAFKPAPLHLPHDYQYDDAAPNATVAPAVLWGAVPSAAAGADGRGQFAAWLTDRDNRQFARTIANRMWRKVMGVGLVEPVDDFRDDNPATYPELLEHLTDLMLALDFDLREFVRVLVTTDAWRRQAVVHDPTSGAPFRFEGPALRRMTAEQLWDSILTLIAHNAWAFQRPTAEAFRDETLVTFSSTTTYGEVEAAYRTFTDVYGRRASQRHLLADYGYHGQVLVRASELPTPLPLGHFLRQFGQSDRETIAGGRTTATVPQILAMFNGPITHAMLERGSVIYDEVMSHPTAQAVDVVFLSVLSHRPTPSDRAAALHEIRTASSPAVGCGNLIWALLNTREFIFIQ